MLQDHGTLGNPSAASGPSLLPGGNPTKERAPLPRSMSNFFRVRRNIRNYGRGIFKPPQMYRLPPIQTLCPDGGPPVPPRHVADRLLAQYRAGMHPFAPLLHWPTFYSEVDSLYKAGTFQGMRRIWVATLFGVLALGTLFNDAQYSNEPPTSSYLEAAVKNINSMSDGVSIDHARAILLISILFNEQNLRSAAWIWLGSAVRTAQECALHHDLQQGPPMQVEMRRRVWWSIYNWDR